MGHQKLLILTTVQILWHITIYITYDLLITVSQEIITFHPVFSRAEDLITSPLTNFPSVPFISKYLTD